MHFMFVLMKRISSSPNHQTSTDLIDHILNQPVLQMVRQTANNMNVPCSIVLCAQKRGLLTKPITPAGIVRTSFYTSNMIVNLNAPLS